MDDWTRVLLYGTFDGFAYSTDDFPRTVVVLDSGERVEVPEECVVSADRMINKNKIKLKDVIARIEMFDLGTKAVWINEILNKLGSDYGLHKYYAGYKQGKFDGAMEREKVTVPQFVADWIEKCKSEKRRLHEALTYTPSGVNSWVSVPKNQETFARAWLDGYEVEKEKQYLVKMKGMQKDCVALKKNKDGGYWYLSDTYPYGSTVNFHTRKELEEAGFGEVFNSPLFEVEEVE